MPVRSRARRGPWRRVLALAAGLLVLGAAFAVAQSGSREEARAARRPHGRASSRVEVLGEQVTRAAPVAGTASTTSSTTSSTTTVPTTTTTTAPPAVLVTAPAAFTTTCADALAYLAAHQAPGFTDVCGGGTALGRLGLTCVDQPGMCEGQRFVHIACPAPFVYMNEADNTWALLGQASGIDPYGQGSDAERAACAAYR